MLNRNIENKTAKLFPLIHRGNTADDLEQYRINTKKVFDSFFNNEDYSFFKEKNHLKLVVEVDRLVSIY
jgi:hypothetical protein